MGDIGPSEIMIIALVVLILFGSTRLPKMAKGLGGALREFRNEIRGLTDDADHGDKYAVAASATGDRPPEPPTQQVTPPPTGGEPATQR